MISEIRDGRFPPKNAEPQGAGRDPARRGRRFFYEFRGDLLDFFAVLNLIFFEKR